MLCLSFLTVRTILSALEAVQKLAEEDQNAQAVTKKENVEGKTKMTHSKNKIISEYFSRLIDEFVWRKCVPGQFHNQSRFSDKCE
jgi:hypothetical protein